ncbi:MAG: hypothetical protein GY754_15850 [bacterium]|nr:hypothetical protein [bacterium]
MDNKKITIICPECSEFNYIEFKNDYKCKKCANGLTSKVYTKFLNSKPVIRTIMALAIGAGGYKGADILMEKNKLFAPEQHRYPIKTEYSIIENCTSRYSRPYSTIVFKKKREICTSALEEVQKEYSYSEFLKNKYNFLKKFRRKVNDKIIEKKRIHRYK